MRFIAVALIAGCSQLPDGLAFRCSDGGVCPTGLRCAAINGDAYCVADDGGELGGGRAGGSVAGGSVAGGSVAGGSVAGGSVAGGSVAGGSVAGGSVAGGSAAGGSAAGGSVAGGAVAGGSVAGGASGGGPVLPDGGLAGVVMRLIPNTEFLGAVAVSDLPRAPGEQLFATLRKTVLPGLTTVTLEGWDSQLVDGGVRRFPATPLQPALPRLISSAGGVMVLGGTSSGTTTIPAEYIEKVDPDDFSNIKGVTLLPSSSNAQINQLRVLRRAGTFDVVALVGGTSSMTMSQVRVWRIEPGSNPPMPQVLSATTPGTIEAEDLAQVSLPGAERLLALVRCKAASCSSTTMAVLNSPVVVATFSYAPDGEVFGEPAQLEAPAIAFDPSSRIRAAANNNHLVLLGQQPSNVGRLRLAWGSPTSPMASVEDTTNTSNGVRAVAAINDSVPGQFLVLGSTNIATTFAGASIPYSGMQHDVFVMRVAIVSSGLSVTVRSFPVSRNQDPVAMALALEPGIVPSYRLMIVGNQGADGFLWSLPWP